MRKLIDGLAIASFVLSLTTVGAIGFGYLAVTNEKNQEKMKQYAIGQVQKLLSDQITKSIPSLPDSTGGVMGSIPDMTNPPASTPRSEGPRSPRK